ncbi:MAG: hypothetical protein DRP09_00790 [Candidatus Thorarchaeota archaeon]|nr:MAG: hypothetical protein DRP09_00790 [Candidatus Thorarchaeota archaeon]
MIHRLHLENFKVFRDQEIVFRKGSTAIVGQNGSGKTSILEAIEFALFRRVTRKEKSIRRLEDLIRHSARKARIELVFTAPINGRQYRVVRTIHPGNKGAVTNADLYIKGNRDPVVSDPARVDGEIVSLLGMDRHAFSALTYVRQGEIDRLSRMTPRDRRMDLFSMMGLGIYDKYSDKVQKQLRTLKKEIANLDTYRERLEEVRKHLPTREEMDTAFNALESMRQTSGQEQESRIIKSILTRIMGSIDEVHKQLESEDLAERPKELREKLETGRHLREILSSIPDVAEGGLRPFIRNEARAIFRELFGDRYSDLAIDDEYDIKLYNLQGHEVPLMAASGGEDVCVNFALRVAVNTALQKHSIAGPPPGLIILDEPGAGLDEQRRRWLPDAIKNLDVVEQVIVVTHMEELRGATDHVITLTPQGKGRQPIVEME